MPSSDAKCRDSDRGVVPRPAQRSAKDGGETRFACVLWRASVTIALRPRGITAGLGELALLQATACKARNRAWP